MHLEVKWASEKFATKELDEEGERSLDIGLLDLFLFGILLLPIPIY